MVPEFNDEPCCSHSAFVPDNSATVNLTTDGVTSDHDIGLVASGAVIPDDHGIKIQKKRQSSARRFVNIVSFVVQKNSLHPLK